MTEGEKMSKKKQKKKAHKNVIILGEPQNNYVKANNSLIVIEEEKEKISFKGKGIIFVLAAVKMFGISFKVGNIYLYKTYENIGYVSDNNKVKEEYTEKVSESKIEDVTSSTTLDSNYDEVYSYKSGTNTKSKNKNKKHN